VKKGYSEVYRFTGGNAEWRSFNYPQDLNNKYRDLRPKKLKPKQVYTLLANQDILIIDVRPKNFVKGPEYIAGSINFPILTITKRLHEIPKDRPIILTDWTMRQSPLAAKFLMANGFDNILGVLKGGLIRWTEEGFPIERHQPQPDDIE